MLIFVDHEHPSGYHTPWGERLQAARLWIKYRLEDLSGLPCLIVRYYRLTPELLAQCGARALVISGNSAARSDYCDAELAGLHRIIRETRLPIFGFCGGMQTIGEAFGAPLAPIGPLAAGEVDPHPEFAPGMKKEFGYLPVTLTAGHPLLAGLGSAPVFRQAHSWELKRLPEGFTLLARSDISPIQLIAHRQRPIAGAQFHPEYYSDDYPAGRRLIENFLRWAGLPLAQQT